jgi:hypothetical protein
MSLRVLLVRRTASGAIVVADAITLARRARPHIERVHAHHAALTPAWSGADTACEPTTIGVSSRHLDRVEQECAAGLKDGLARPLRRHAWVCGPVTLRLYDRRTRTVVDERVMPPPDEPWPEPYATLAREVRDVVALAHVRPALADEVVWPDDMEDSWNAA